MTLWHKQKRISQVARAYIETLNIAPRNTRQPLIVAMVGVVGSGKTTLAQRLASPLKAVILNKDRALHELQTHGLAHVPALTFLFKIIPEILKRGGNIIFYLWYR